MGKVPADALPLEWAQNRDRKIFCPWAGSSGLGRPQRQRSLIEPCGRRRGVSQAQGLIAVAPPCTARCLLVPILGRQPGRELEGFPVSAQRPKDGHHPVGRGKSSWPRREVMVLTAGVVCPDRVSRTQLLAVLLRWPAGAESLPLP